MYGMAPRHGQDPSGHRAGRAGHRTSSQEDAVLILDEPGDLPFSASGSALLFQLLGHCYGRPVSSSVVI